MNAFKTLGLAVAATSIAPLASAVPVTFSDFRNNPFGFLENANSGSSTVDGVTLTADLLDDDSTFEATGGGTGVDSGATNIGNNGEFQIGTGEVFTISFDTDGTLDSFTVGVFPASSTVTFTNQQTGLSDAATYTANGNNFTGDSVGDLNLAFSAGDLITVNSVAVSPSNVAASTGYRIQAIQIDAVPEPASMALLAAGGVLLLGRRRA